MARSDFDDQLEPTPDERRLAEVVMLAVGLLLAGAGLMLALGWI